VKFKPLIKNKLQSFNKFIELDVCGRPLFANPVTNRDGSEMIELQDLLYNNVSIK